MTTYRYTVTLDARGSFVSANSDQSQLREWAIEDARQTVEAGNFIVIDVQVTEET